MPEKAGKPKSLWDGKIVRQALVDAVAKLNPRTMMRNPVMFVVEAGSAVTSVLLIKDFFIKSPAVRDLTGARGSARAAY